MFGKLPKISYKFGIFPKNGDHSGIFGIEVEYRDR